jgi:hypothetical protein
MTALKLTWAATALIATTAFALTASAESIECKGAKDCEAKIKASITSGTGAVCFSDQWVPKPDQGWPELCTKTFSCASHKLIAMRAYFPEMRTFAAWVDDPHRNTKEVRYIGACLYRAGKEYNHQKSCSKYTDWAMDPRSGDVTSQGEPLVGKVPGKDHLTPFAPPQHFASPERFCQEPDKQETFVWEMIAKKRLETDDARIRAQGDHLEVEAVQDDQFKILAAGTFDLTK